MTSETPNLHVSKNISKTKQDIEKLHEKAIEAGVEMLFCCV